MKIKFSKTYVDIIRELGDKKHYSSKTSWGSAESALWYAIKKKLIELGYDVIKKRMQSDGHMMGDNDTQYIRSRKFIPGSIMIYDHKYAIRNLAEDWNKIGNICLAVTSAIIEE